MSDQYSNMAELVQLSIKAALLEKNGDISQAKMIRKLIAEKQNEIHSENEKLYRRYVGNDDYETEQNIYNEVLDRIRNDQEYVQFLFEELDAASQGNDFTQNFTKNCGIEPRYFKGSLNGTSSIDRDDGPQQFLSNAIMTIYGVNQVGVSHRIAIVENFIREGFKRGILDQYASPNIVNIKENQRLIDVVNKVSNLDCGTFGNISDDLGLIYNLREQPSIIQMAYGYARRTAAAGLFLQGVFSYDVFKHVCQVFKSLQMTTGHTAEFQKVAAAQAWELLQSYDNRFDKNFISAITSMAIGNENDLNIQQYPTRSYEETITSLLKVVREHLGNETEARKATLKIDNDYNSYYTESLRIDSLLSSENRSVVVLNIIENRCNMIYNNIYDTSFYDKEDDGFLFFRGPVYRIELKLKNGDVFDIFYGIISADRELITSTMTSAVIDEYCGHVLNEIYAKCPNLFNLQLFQSAPTHYTFRYRRGPSYYYITNNRGTEAFYFSFDNSKIEYGTRDYILNFMREHSSSESIEDKSESNTSSNTLINNNITQETTEKSKFSTIFWIVIVIATVIFFVYNKNKKSNSYYYNNSSQTELSQNRNLNHSLNNNSNNNSYNDNNRYQSNHGNNNNFGNLSNHNYGSMDVLQLLQESSKIVNDSSLMSKPKNLNLQAVYKNLVKKLKEDVSSNDLIKLNMAISKTEDQITQIKDFIENSKISSELNDDFYTLFYWTKIQELGYISSNISWESKVEYCKNPLNCTKYETSRIYSSFADRYNNLREVCQAGYCIEELIKEQERIWIDYDEYMNPIITSNSYSYNNKNNLKLNLVLNQSSMILNLHALFQKNISQHNSYFNYTSNKTLYDSLAMVQTRLYNKNYYNSELSELNAQLSSITLPYLYYQLSKKGIDISNLDISSGAYDLTYRIFLVSSNKQYFGSTYDRSETEIAKVEGKINRAKHLLYLLLSDYEISQISTSFNGFNCIHNPCSFQDFRRNGQRLENIFNQLVRQCKSRKCNKTSLYSQENNWVAYTKEWLKMLNKTQYNEDTKNHIKILYDNDNIRRLSKAYNTYQ